MGIYCPSKRLPRQPGNLIAIPSWGDGTLRRLQTKKITQLIYNKGVPVLIRLGTLMFLIQEQWKSVNINQWVTEYQLARNDCNWGTLKKLKSRVKLLNLYDPNCDDLTSLYKILTWVVLTLVLNSFLAGKGTPRKIFSFSARNVQLPASFTSTLEQGLLPNWFSLLIFHHELDPT